MKASLKLEFDVSLEELFNDNEEREKTLSSYLGENYHAFAGITEGGDLALFWCYNRSDDSKQDYLLAATIADLVAYEMQYTPMDERKIWAEKLRAMADAVDAAPEPEHVY